jgi:hypothetical protein
LTGDCQKDFSFCPLQIYDGFLLVPVRFPLYFNGNVTANVSKICNRFKNATIQRRGWSLQYLDELATKQTWSKDVADLLRKAEGLQTTEGVFVVFV